MILPNSVKLALCNDYFILKSYKKYSMGYRILFCFELDAEAGKVGVVVADREATRGGRCRRGCDQGRELAVKIRVWEWVKACVQCSGRFAIVIIGLVGAWSLESQEGG